ncbi:Hypothetical predicted protein [Olea europaea subsp. europaea]|uniref:Uncharacterized protein n=1 Tax=Olea europaea subsp. europaea TaxID=158383 RepID=A0A8S0U723_OLEEU|nr:Hypothetical predicted protein [Olea europaea subsp. europaea]
MMGIEEYEGDLIDLVDLDFKDVDEEDDFIAHSIAEFMIDFTKSLQKGWYCSQSLNGIKMGEKTLAVRRANQGTTQTKFIFETVHGPAAVIIYFDIFETVH